MPKTEAGAAQSAELLQYHDLVTAIVAALEARDAYTARHSDRVADMVLVLAGALHLTEDETATVHMAAHLHDIGKIAIPDAVLRKTGPLTDAEETLLRRHPMTGYKILHSVAQFEQIAELVRCHHEQWDGGGYPDGLAGEAVPRGARIIAVADAIDAMMCSRGCRPAMSPAACRRAVAAGRGQRFDPQVVDAALAQWDALIARYAAPDIPAAPYYDRLLLEHTRQAHDYLLQNQDKHITLPELAARFHLSQSSLKLCFKALYGAPVAGYLRAARMQTAAQLLRTTDLPVADIAHRVGYEDPSRFAAAFRRQLGQRPSDLRRVALPPEPPV